MEKNSFKVRLGALLASLWIRSLRIRLAVPDNFSPGILGTWHRDLLASAAAFKDMGVHAFVSESSDGDFFAEAARRLGYSVTRGSSSHGATNVRHVLQSLEQGKFAGMALDGPHGPARQVKPGSIWLSEKSGRPLWQISVKYGAHIRLKTWDNFILPLPMSSIVMEIKYLCPSNNSTKVI